MAPPICPAKIRPSTVVQSLRCLVNLLSCGPLLAKFRAQAATTESSVPTSAGGKETTARGVARTFSVAISDNENSLASPSGGGGGGGGLQLAGGFQLLNWILINHVELPQVYHLLIGLMAGRSQPKISDQLDSESALNCLFGGRSTGSSSSSLPPMHCPEAIVTLLSMIRSVMNPPAVTQEGEVGEEEQEAADASSSAFHYPNVLLSLMFHVYNNSPDYMVIFMTNDVINALIACLFGNASISNHMAKKTLIDFLRTIVVDSLSLPPPPPPPQVAVEAVIKDRLVVDRINCCCRVWLMAVDLILYCRH